MTLNLDKFVSHISIHSVSHFQKEFEKERSGEIEIIPDSERRVGQFSALYFTRALETHSVT